MAITPPDGAPLVQIRVTRLAARGRKPIATVYRAAPTARRYRFRLTERKLRALKPGRYLIEVRVGKSRTELGPVTKRILTVKAAKRAA